MNKPIKDLSDLKLWLVTGEIEKQLYMSSRSERLSEIRLVAAGSEAEAAEKFSEHFESLSSEYAVHYTVTVKCVSGVIT